MFQKCRRFGTVSLPLLAPSGRFSVVGAVCSRTFPVRVRSAALHVGSFPQQAEVSRRPQQ